jgi:hypothetical protein
VGAHVSILDGYSGSRSAVFLKSIIWDVCDPLDHFVTDPPTMNEVQKLFGWNVETTGSF